MRSRRLGQHGFRRCMFQAGVDVVPKVSWKQTEARCSCYIIMGRSDLATVDGQICGDAAGCK